MAIEFNGKFVNVNNAQVSGKKIDTEKKGIAAQKNVFDGENKVDNKFQGGEIDLSKDPKAIYGSMGLSLGNTKKSDLNAQITNLVGPSVMKRVASTPVKSAENISSSANLALDNILADDTGALFAMAGLNQPVNAPSLEYMQKTLNESSFEKALFA